MEKLSLEELQPLILDWAREKNLLFEENAPKQRLKLIEECGELASAILKNDIKLQKDAIGDIFVVLIIFAYQMSFEYNSDLNIHKSYDFHKKEVDFHLNGILNSTYWFIHDENALGHELSLAGLNEISEVLNLDLTECANLAWNEIKDRKGKTVNGTFIKN